MCIIIIRLFENQLPTSVSREDNQKINQVFKTDILLYLLFIALPFIKIYFQHEIAIYLVQQVLSK